MFLANFGYVQTELNQTHNFFNDFFNAIVLINFAVQKYLHVVCKSRTIKATKLSNEKCLTACLAARLPPLSMDLA